MDVPFPRGKSESDEKSTKSNKRSDTAPAEDELFKVKRFRKVEPAKPTKAPAKRKREAEKSNLLASPLPEIGLGMTKSVANNKVIKIDTINFGNYVTGSQALGYILQVHDDAIVVSLPGGVSGTVQLSEISDVHNKISRQQLDKNAKASVGELSDILTVMQPVKCYVLNTSVDTAAATHKKTKGRKTLNLSMRPSYVNRGLTSAHMIPGFPISGTVSSVEDRMYMISTGVSGFTFILPFTAVPTAISPLRLGQPIDALVESINNPAKTITLRAQRKAVSSAVVAGVKLTFNSLAPGMLVNAIVDKVVDNGLIVGFFGLFFGTIDNYNLSRLYNGKDNDWKSHFEEGGVTHARIVYVDHANKSVRLSLRPHVLEYRAPKFLPALGDTLKDFKVSAVVKRTGLYITHTDENEDENTAMVGLTIKKGSKKAQAAALQKQRDADEAAIQGVFVHKSSLADASGNGSSGQGKDAVGWESRYKLGKSMDVRVSGYHLVEGIAIASNVDAYMTGSVVHSSQVEVGQVLEVEVIKVADFGLVVKLGGKVRAICPVMHLSDTAGNVKTATLIKKFKVGQKHTMRVWEVKGAQIVMTNKKSIVQADLALSSYAQADEGTVAQGIVSKVSQAGLQIHFFNKVKGDIPSSILVKQGVTDIEENYRIGQVVQCFVLQRIVPKETSRKINSTLILGLNLGNVAALMTAPSTEVPEVAESPEKATSTETSSPLEVVTGTVIKTENDVVHVRLESGDLALLHKDHLCDIASHCAALFAKINDFLPAGATVTGVHLGANKNGSINMSIKPLFLAVAGVKAADSEHVVTAAAQDMTIPNRIGDLHPGQLVAGSVWKVESYGILVRFRDGMTALAPRPNVADTFISSPVGLFNIGDSVRCVIQRVDLTRERAIVTLKPTTVPPSAGNMLYVASLLQEKYRIAKETTSLDWKHNGIGQVVKATVTAVKSYGVVLMGTDNVTMMLAKTADGSNFAEGDAVDALVLDIDFENSVLDVTLDTDLVSTIKKTQASQAASKKKKTKKISAECSVGEICHNSVIALVKDQYVVVVVKGVVCFVMIADYHCPYKTTADYKVQQTLSVKVERCLPNSFASYLHNTERSSPYSLTAMGSVFVEGNDAQRKLSASLQQEAEGSDGKIDSQLPPSDTAVTQQQQQQQPTRQKFVESLRIGAMLKWEVVGVSSTSVTVMPEHHSDMKVNITASIHVSSAVDSCDGCDDLESILDKIALDDDGSCDREGISVYHPFHGISKGSKVSARVIQVRHVDADEDAADKTKRLIVYLSLPPQKKSKKNTASAHWKRMLQWSGRESIKMDTLYAGAITTIHKSHCTVALSPYISANISILDISKDISLIEKFRDYCHVGMKLICTVTELVTSNKQKHSISISRALVEDIASGSVHVDLTKTVTVDVPHEHAGSSDKMVPGDVMLGVVDMSAHSHAKKPPALTVVLSNGKRGRVCVTEVSDTGSWKDYTALFAAHAARQHQHQKRSRSGSNVSLMSTDSSVGHVNNDDEDDCDIFDGKVVKCCVLTSSPGLELSLRNSRVHAKSKTKATVLDAIPAPGAVVQGYVANTTLKGCFVRLTSRITGRVLMKELSDDFVEAPMDVYTAGKLVQAKVLSVTDNTQGDSDNLGAIQVDLSLRSSAVNGDMGGKDFNSLKKGDIVSGTVHRVTDFGVFVAISGTSLVGLSRKAMAAAKDDEDLATMYEEGDNVRAVVISKSVGNKIALGLKASYFNGEASDDDDENEMDIDSDASGSDDDDDEEEENSEENSDEDEDEEEVDGSDDDEDGSDDDEDNDNDDFIVGYEDVSDSDDDDDVAALIRNAAMHTGDTDNSGSDDDDDDDEEESPVPAAKKAKKNVPQPASEDSESDSDSEGDEKQSFMSRSNKSAAAGGAMMLNWGDNFKPAAAAAVASKDSEDEESEEEESEEEEEEESSGAAHSGRKKVSQRRKDEEATRQKEAALLSGSAEPSSPEDFERLIITQPNSSLLWIQYMSFFMLAADIESARGIAHRALRTINFREEDEKYNVWVALINLEHKYGTMASLEKCFKQGVSETKGKYLHIHLAELYDTANDVKGARLLFERAIKKHKTSKKVWMAYQHFELRRHNDKEARALLGRSMLSLSRHKHIEVILQYASLQFELGNFDMGREVFEDLLQNYPKRTDIWNVFVDKEVKYKNFNNARRIFERMICLKINAKNVKSIFKKYLTFELSHGTVTEQNGVKQKAREYVESLM
jgi:ribosomal protein S1